MNREIKFRAWCTANKRMEYDVQTYVRKFINDVFIELTHHNFMQFTGLLDKNGVEVYEGDIIEGIMNYSKSKFKSHVFYSDGAFRVDTGSLICNATFEVIGNIYEDQELLEGL